MKKETKQKFINLLEKVFNDSDFTISNLYVNLNKVLKDYIKQKCPYLDAVRDLSFYLHQHLKTDNSHFADTDFIYQLIQNAIEILNTPIRELKDKKAAIQRQLELEQYNKELPVKLLELLAEADNLKLKYKVIKIENKLNISLYKENTDYKRYGADIEINLPGNHNEYYEAVNYMSTIKEELEKEKLT
jgi:hypothetical protein